MVRLKEKGFLEAFKKVFRYQLRRKFGLSNEMNTFEKCLRLFIIPGYVLLLYFFTHYHYKIFLILLIFVGCAWLSETAMDSIRRIYHYRYELDKGHKGFREIKDFTLLEKLAAYLISAFILAVIFAGSLFLITFIRTGELNVKLFIGMLSIPVVLLYNLRKDKKF